MTTARFALVRNADSESQLERYLPEDYTVVGQFQDGRGANLFVIAGQDNAGWTLDEYVIPRLASGLIFAEEIPQDEVTHIGITKLVPAFGTLLIVRALSDKDFMVRSLTMTDHGKDHDAIPYINGIPTEILVWVEKMDDDRFILGNNILKRKDRGFYADTTDGARRKVLDYILKELGPSLEPSFFRAGEIASLDNEIRNDNLKIRELENQIADVRNEMTAKLARKSKLLELESAPQG